MYRFLSCLALVSAFTMPTIARADSFTNFELNGYTHLTGTNQVITGYVTGLLTLDTTTGRFVGGSLDYLTLPYVFQVYQSQQDKFSENDFSFSNTVDINGYSTEPGRAQFNIGLSLNLPAASLIGYQGGDICSELNFAVCGGAGSSFTPRGQEYFAFNDGTLTPAPEPSSLVLLGTGVIGLIGSTARRRGRC